MLKLLFLFIVVLLILGLLVAAARIVTRRTEKPAASAASQPVPYVASGSILSPAEQRFLPVLEAAVAQISGGQGRVYVQLPYSRILTMRSGLDNSQRTTHRNKIDRKSADFVVVGPGFVPRIVVELDDRSHDRADRRQRDEFVERALADAGVRLVRVKVRGGYDVAELAECLGAGNGQRDPQQLHPG